MLNRYWRIVSIAASLAWETTVWSQVTYQTVALTGQAAPGAGAAVSYLDFRSEPPKINDVGQIAFVARLGGAGVNDENNVALYAGAFAGLQLVARKGNAVAGGGGGIAYADFSRPTLNDAGQVAFVAHLRGADVTDANNSALCAGAFDEPRPVARAGDEVPDAGAGVKFAPGFAIGSLNDAGGIGFGGYLAGTGVTEANDSALFAGELAKPQMIAREGDPAPDAGAGVTYGKFGGYGPGFNDAGQLVYLARLAGETPQHGSAIYGGTLAARRLIGKTGNRARGTTGRYTDFYQLPVINDAGQVAFAVRLFGSAAVFVGDPSSPKPIARGLEAAPGMEEGITYHPYTFGRSKINESSQIAFTTRVHGAGVTPANQEVLFAGDLAKPQLIARAGDAVPGTGDGVTYARLFEVELNDAGQVAYKASLAGNDVTKANDLGLFAFDPARGGLLIAREGDRFDVGGGDLRTVADDGIGYSQGTGDDLYASLSNDGRLVFRLNFTDGTAGVFVSTISGTLRQGQELPR